MRKLFLGLFLAIAFASQALAIQPTKSASSGNVANATATATFAASLQQTNYLSGFEVTTGGITIGACVNLTITGLTGGTLTYPYCAPTGVTVGAYPFSMQFIPPLSGAAINTAITVSLPALGAGNTNAAVNIHGYTE